jgi:hypothetical protein
MPRLRKQNALTREKRAAVDDVVRAVDGSDAGTPRAARPLASTPR